MVFHQCSSGCWVRAAAADEGGGAGMRRSQAYTVDMHCHVMTPEIERLVSPRPEKMAELAQLARGLGAQSTEHNNRVMLPSAGPKLTNLAMRLADMDAMGVDLQVISPSPTQYYYWAERDLAETLIREQNEAIAGVCQQNPQRLMGLGNVALQHGALAADQLTYAVKELGLKGVEVSTSVNGLDLGDPAFAPFWERANELHCIVFVHPFGTSLGERLQRYYLGNVIGQPIETAIAITDLIFSGVMDRCDKVKIIAAHGGGYLPTYIGRSDHAYKVRPEAHVCSKAPSEYLKSIWYDTIVYDALGLRHLIDRVGVSQILVGTDYPFDMGHYTPHYLIDSVADLTESDKRAILGGNALSLLRSA